jgi:hypothetical protein
MVEASLKHGTRGTLIATSHMRWYGGGDQFISVIMYDLRLEITIYYTGEGKLYYKTIIQKVRYPSQAI